MATITTGTRIAINSTTVEVALGTAATSADVTGTKFSIKDDAGKEIAVKSAELAAYNTDNKAVLLTLEADTTVGTLYTLTVGDKTFNFGGIAKDSTKPEIKKIESTYFNEVKIIFTEPIKTFGTVKIAKKMGDKAELAASDIKYSGNDAIKVKTAEQAKSTLYVVTVEGFADFAGNTMDKSDSKTFTGTEKLAKLKVDDAKAYQHDKVVVKFNSRIDEASISAECFKITKTTGDKAAITVSSAAISTEVEENKAFGSKSDNKKCVTLTLGTSLSKSTLYKIEVVGNIKGDGAQAIDTDNDTDTFTGVDKPTELKLSDATASKNTQVIAKFSNDVEKATAEVIANYAITKQTGDKSTLAISKAEIDGDNPNWVKLTVASMEGSLYKLAVVNVKDIFGNTVKSDADEDTFAGAKVEDKITEISSAAIKSDDSTKLVVDFNRKIGDSAKDVSHYFIDNGIGYPSKVEITDAAAGTVTLTIPKTTDAKPYKLTVKNLANADGIMMDASGVSKTFIGKGESAGLPKIEGIVATDKQTIQVIFDRSVDDKTIKGQLWNDNKLIDASGWLVKYSDESSYTGTLNGKMVAAGQNAYVYKSPDDAKILIIRGTAEAFKKKSDSVQTMKLTISSTYVNDDNNEMEFATNDDSPKAVELEGIQGIDERTIELFFNQAIDKASLEALISNANDPDDITVKLKDGSDVINDFTSVVKVSDTQYKLISNATTEPKFLDKEYTFTWEKAGNNDIMDVSGKVGYKDFSSKAKPIDAYSFAGSSASISDIKDVTALMTSKRTIDVYFPVKMLDSADGNGVKNNVNYKFKDNKTSSIAKNPDYVIYDGDNNKVTLYYQEDIDSSDFTSGADKYYIVIDNPIKDATGLYSIKDGDSDLSVEFALNDDSREKPSISTADLSLDGSYVDVSLSTDVAFGTAASIAFDGAASDVNNNISINEFKSYASLSTDTFETTDITSYFKVTGKDVSDNDLGIMSAVRLSNSKVRLTFTAKPKNSSDIIIALAPSTDAAGIYDITKTRSEGNSSDVSKITIGAPEGYTSAYDRNAPISTITAQFVEGGVNVSFKSTEIGTAYLILNSTDPNDCDTVTKLEGMVTAHTATKVSVASANVTATIAAPAAAGQYALVVTDASGNVSAKSTILVTVAASTGVSGANNTTTEGVTAAAQVEIATVAIDTAAAGTINVIVTAAGMTGNPKTVAVPVLATDTTSDAIAAKVRTALNADADINSFFTVGGTGAAIILTAKTIATNDTNMNINLSKNGTTIITDAASSNNATLGALAVAEVNTITINDPATATGTMTVAFNDTTINKTVNVSVLQGDTTAQVAAKVAAALIADTQINAAYNVTYTAGSSNIVITRKTVGDITITITIGG